MVLLHKTSEGCFVALEELPDERRFLRPKRRATDGLASARRMR